MGGRLLCLPPSLCRDELEAQLRRFLLHVFHFIFQHPIHHLGDSVGGRHCRLSRSQSRTQAPIHHPKRTTHLYRRFRGHPECLPCTFFRFQGFVLQHLAPGDLMLGHQPQPRTKTLLGRKLLSDIATHFHRHCLSQ